ncbi:hypothetical protein QVD99_003351 [Batrachochytrium dendrobatidis]|nr:hypothetical protein QVD99_003351 [Batrachochytrium dendrobatidis]
MVVGQDEDHGHLCGGIDLRGWSPSPPTTHVVSRGSPYSTAFINKATSTGSEDHE